MVFSAYSLIFFQCKSLRLQQLWRAAGQNHKTSYQICTCNIFCLSSMQVILVLIILLLSNDDTFS